MLTPATTPPAHVRTASHGLLLLMGTALMMTASPAASAQSVFVNEIHYDNTGGDVGEFVEVAGPAGTDLSDWSVELYNGAGGNRYATVRLSGTIPDQQDGFGTLSFAREGIQNGDTDGLALVGPGATNVQFLSYRGTFEATDGAAEGMTSTDIGVSEEPPPPAGQSLQLAGAGTAYGDFAWTGPGEDSPGNVNAGQTFGMASGSGGIVVDTGADEDNADGDCSLREAIRAANTNAAVDGCAAGAPDGDTITFAASYTVALTLGELLVSDDVAIDASAVGSVTVDAQGASRVFDVDAAGGAGSEQRVAFTSLRLQNGDSRTGSSAPDAGGAVDLKAGSEATFTDVDVTDSVAGVNGGGIHGADGTSIVITTTNGGSSTIRGNEARGAEAGMGGGGVWGAGSTTISGNVAVEGNRATGAAGSGGGVFNSGGTLMVMTTTVSGNTANRAGGGVEADGERSTTILVMTNVTGNDAGANPGNGGAVHGGGGTVVVGGGTFADNTAVEGGGLWSSGFLIVTADEDDMAARAADRVGGAMMTQMWDMMAAQNVSIEAALVTRNEATGDDADQGGGGLYNQGGFVQIAGLPNDDLGDDADGGVVVSENVASGASGSGGGILNNGGTLLIDGGDILGNRAARAGAGIEDAGGTVALNDVAVRGNAIAGANPGNGGGLHSGGGSVTVNGGAFTGNTAVEGGGLWSNAALVVQPARDVPTLIAGNTATGDDAANGGGGLYAETGADVTVTSARFSDNGATGAAGSGGAVLVAGGASVSMTLGEVSGNRANRAGGGVEVADGGTLSLSKVSVDGNRIASANPGNGGGVHVGGAGSATLSQTTVSNNSSAQGGGLWNSASGTLAVSNSTVSGNAASGDGGGVYTLPGGDTSLESVTVVRNVAGANGGGLAISSLVGSATVSVDNAIVGDNTAAGSGDDCFGRYATGGFLLVEDRGDDCAFNGAGENTIFGQDPALAPLADNGGPTLTHALLNDSPAIDAGQTALAVDQRGEPRGDDQDDLGAFERGDGDGGGAVACSQNSRVSFDADGNGTPTSVMADDFSTVPGGSFMNATGEFAGVRNEGDLAVDLSTCSFVTFDPFDETVRYSAVADGTVTPGDVYVLASAGGDKALPDDVFFDDPGAFALVEGTAAAGAPVASVLGRVVAAVVYDRDRAVFGSVGGAATEAEMQAFRQALLSVFGQAVSAEGAGEIDLTVAAWPNPTASQATVAFGLAEGGAARVAVYDALGREVVVAADGPFARGRHEVSLRAGSLPAGVYVVRVATGGGVQTARLTVAR
ncbi:choice-of-anchor Q domain-containing protein [Rubrivirga sp. S365]|uniref:choice-of-anchor Q domain-containing protein n=1 Tax=Rubrivirga sp. S365 TaxID=3076080 RepID=UPI0028C7E191|nr:choice-of-anchor Q domain-containing protein [Rubrivirga sp. S365]MDT7857595.1 choice-of-anchor Q domain-containing protein [Rubrivirga sp. S365]